MRKDYETPEIKIAKFAKNESVFTSGPTDLHDGEEFDPSENGSSGAKNYFYND